MCRVYRKNQNIIVTAIDGIASGAMKNLVEHIVQMQGGNVIVQGLIHQTGEDGEIIKKYQFIIDEPEFIENALGCTFPMSAGSQKDTFQAVIMNTLGESCEYEVIRNIHDNLQEIIEEATTQGAAQGAKILSKAGKEITEEVTSLATLIELSIISSVEV